METMTEAQRIAEALRMAIDAGSWRVKSDSLSNRAYRVTLEEWMGRSHAVACTCQGYEHHGRCKHIVRTNALLHLHGAAL